MANTVAVEISKNDITAFRELNITQARCCIGTRETIPDEARISLEYLHQGGANIVFKIRASQDRRDGLQSLLFVDMHKDVGLAGSLNSSEFCNKVLRVHKGLEKTLRSEEVIQGFEEVVKPLFRPGTKSVVTNNTATWHPAHTPTATALELPNHNLTAFLMDHEPVALFPDAMAAITSQSKDICQKQGAKILTSARWGILLPDMSPVPGSSITLEIKPKWLVQSPTAPVDAVRCRTCALQIRKPKDPKQYICPLQWTHGNFDDIYRWVYGRVASKLEIEEANGCPKLEAEELEVRTTAIATHIAAYLAKGPGSTLLKHLEFLQSRLDPQGVLRHAESSPKDVFDHNLRLAMTLRDCSMYINVRYDNVDAPKINCKLGDLDFKSADKMNDWVEKEQELIASGAYTNVGVQSEPRCIYGKIRR